MVSYHQDPALTVDNGHRMIYGTEEGVYFSNLRDEKLREPVKVINLLDVTQVDVIEEFQLLVVLHERSVTTFPLDCLDPNDPNAALKRGKRISSHTSFFKSGVCLGKTLVAVVKSSTLSSTIKVLEPVDQSLRGKKPQASFMKRLNGGNETLKLFKVGLSHSDFADPRPGILHSHRVKLRPLSQDEAVCRVYEGVRDRRFGDTRYARSARSLGRFAGLCPQTGQCPAYRYLSNRGGFPAMLRW